MNDHLKRAPKNAAFAVVSSLPALVIGSLGGAAFVWLHMPLPWMLGAMFLVAVLSLFLPRRQSKYLRVNTGFRALMITVLGVLLGSGFTPAMIARLPELGGLMLIMLVFLPIGGAVSYAVFRRIGNLPKVESYFSAMPGGLTEMTLMGESMGGNPRQIVLVHAVRVFVVVMTIPFYFRIFEGYVAQPLNFSATGNHVSPQDALLLIACGIAGWLLGRRVNLPAAQLVGPMLFSAAVHLAGFSTAKPPPELVAMAQVAMGAGLGARFVGLPLIEIRRLAWLAVISTFAMLAAAILVSFLASWITGFSRQTILLTISPGGVAEISLVALALGIDATIVTCMHIFRIVTVVFFAKPVFKLAGIKPVAPE